ncbi:MAG: thrombospondin type 3 repeat-containing protein [Myxococcales bacterium]
MTSRRLSLLASLLLALAPTAVQAEYVGGFNAQNHDPTYAGDRFFASPDATVDGHLVPSVKLTLDYSYGALRLVDRSTGQVAAGGMLLKDQLYLNLDASLTLFNRVEVAVGLPFAVYQSGESLLSGSKNVGSAMSDFRVGARVAFVGKPRETWSLGASADLWIPTGSVQDFSSDPDARGHIRLIASGLIQEMVPWSVSLGGMIRAHHDVGLQKVGSALTYSAAAGALLLDKKLQVGPELFGSVTPVSGRAPLEAMLGARYCISSFTFGAGIGAGLTDAPGTAQFRAMANIEWTLGRVCGEPDADGDGIVDAKDACPTEKGIASDDPAKNGCPPPDTDRDGIIDAEDACPTLPGVASTDPKKHGCPPDCDGDGIYDADDACPDVPGVKSADAAKNGCPPDRDGDGIYDADDACPDVPGVKSADPKKHGCPADRDGDGILDADDACPDVPGVKSADRKQNGCPPDKDGDGIFDADDACPTLPGQKSADPKLNGCPDKDGDGILDADDACPEAAGPANKDKKKHGCPPDKDGDGVPDVVDACPDKPGPASEDPKKNGCPAVAVLRKDSIVILQQVQFDTAKDTIKPVSNKLLGEVATILREHPEIEVIAVEGHTDDRGQTEMNRDLSRRRAEAVKKWLITKGKIDAGRLTAAGFGPDRPIDTNKTEKGRQNNRRVEFKIVPKGDAAAPAPPEPTKVEPAKPEPAKPEPAKADPAKGQPKKEAPKKKAAAKDDPLAPLVDPAKKAAPQDDPLAPLTPSKK